MQRRFAYAEFVAAVEYTRLSGRKSDGVVNHGPIHRAKIFYQKCFAFEPDARMTSRHFRFRIESRQIDLGEDLTVWSCPSKRVALLLQYERRIEFGRAGNNELRRRPRGMRQRTRCTNRRQRLPCAAARAEDVFNSK